MDLQTIATRTGLPIRLARYVADHDVLPGTTVPQLLPAKGQPRDFTELEAFTVAIAAVFLDAGVRRSTVKDYLRTLCGLRMTLVKGVGDHVLGAVRATRFPALARFADGKAVRVIHHGKDSGWHPADSFSGEPRFLLELDLGSLRDDLFRRE